MPYTKGELEAIAYKDGKQIGLSTLKTLGKPASIRLIADRDMISADKVDLSYVSVEVVDA